MAPEEEQRAVAEVVERLLKRFPTMPAQRVTNVVDSISATFREARIRDYIPILIEREARDHLAHLAH